MHDPGLLRRLLLAVLVVVGAAAATRLLASILSGDGLSLAEIGILILFALTFGWISLAFWTAVAGFFQLAMGGARARPGARLLEPAPHTPLGIRTALLMPVCHEDPDEVGARLAAVYRSIERTGELPAFDLFVLSDSRRPEVAREEEAMWARLVGELDARGRLFYRRRQDNHGRKSGNIAEFCRRWGRRYEAFVALDADSVMAGETLVRLARLLEANPRAALIQTVPQPIRATTLFARIQQFAARLYGPVHAAGTAFWFPGKGNYWGHNAIIRPEPFMACCGLPALPGTPPLGGEIMSHDFVEAALLRRAGWEVWLEPSFGGSYEELPPTLDDYAKRDRRWCQGNLQHARLLALKGLCPVSRGHLAMGVMAYLASPLWFLLLALTTFEAARTDLGDWVYFPEAGILFPVWPIARAVELIGLFTVTMGMLLLPKALSLALALADPALRRSFGGALRMLRSAALEIVLAALLAPILMVQQTAAVVTTLLGHQVLWTNQQRAGGAQSWRAAARGYAPVTLLGVAWGGLAWWLTPDLLFWLTPVLAGLLLSVPLAYLTGRADLGLRTRRAGWFLIPEETAPPPELTRLSAPAGTQAALPVPARPAPALAKTG